MVSIPMDKMSSQTQTTGTKTGFLSETSRWVIPALLAAAAILLLASISYPYWVMHLDAPQYDYRNGLNVVVYIDEMTGKDPHFDELRELNGLNHYIGMRHLQDAAVFERSIALLSIFAFIVLLVVAAGVVVSNKQWSYTWLLTFPPLFFPAVFMADLYYWLRDSGLNLDPTAPFSSTIKPFVPTLLGGGKVGQFSTDSRLDTGMYFAIAASLCILMALVISFVQYRQQAQSKGGTSAHA
jgi:hypothetical protein